MTTRFEAKKLIALLKEQRPKSDAEARECESTARILALELDIPVGRRKEGEEIPEGFCTWYDDDKYNIGALLRCGGSVWGWRWSVIRQICSDWSR